MNRRKCNRWGVILAEGDGTKLLALTRALTGDDTPKQFCALTGGATLLDETRRRIAEIVPEEQTLFVLTEKHRRFFGPQLSGIDGGRLLVQPWNHGTAAQSRGVWRASRDRIPAPWWRSFLRTITSGMKTRS